MRAAYLLSDIVSIAVAITAVGLGNKFLGGIAWNTWTFSDLKVYGLLAGGMLVVAMLQRTYSAIPSRPVRQFPGWVRGSAAICGTEIAILALFGLGTVPLFVTLVVAMGSGVLLASFNRAMCRIFFGKASWWGTRLIVVGSGNRTAEAFADLEREPQWGLRPVGLIDDSNLLRGNLDAACYSDKLEHLDQLALRLNADRALVAVESFGADEFADLLSRAGSRIRHWIIQPPLYRFPSLWLEPCEAARLPAFACTNRLAVAWSYPMKRAFDVCVAIGVGMVSLPLLAAIALLIRLTSPGPIFYGHPRSGLNGRRFKAWKFRTMVPNGAAVLADYLARHPEVAAEWNANHKLRNDPRVTWAGGWLRQISLDELPQLWNVLVGDMSFVGPRPIVDDEIEQYGDRYQHLIQVLPGITGLWQVSGRNNTTFEERIALNAYYVQNWSLWFDIYILACTVKVVLRGEGAY
jgi:Undecaprenyl-phosphate galactose phosphotransferase WbaP